MTRATQSAAYELTRRDSEYVKVLTHELRCMTIEQIRRTWWKNGGSRSNVRARLREVESLGLVKLRTTMARPELECRVPLLRWQPGDPEPDVQAIASLVRKRWANTSAAAAEIVVATRKAINMFGGHIRRLRATESTHEIGLAGVYLGHYRATHWVSDLEQYNDPERKRDDLLPDALIRDDAGETQYAVEFAGQYSRDKVAQIHANFEAAGMAYVLW